MTNIAIIEPFYSGSHKYWVDRLSQHLPQAKSFTLPGRHWKWRMAAGAQELAEKVNNSNADISVFLVTDMLDLPKFKGFLSPEYAARPMVLYMHENQVSYPNQKDVDTDRHYGLINYQSVCASHEVWFNSEFHRQSFFSNMRSFLHPFPDSKLLINRLDDVYRKTKVVPLGIDFNEINPVLVGRGSVPRILWNNRWEHDKNPEAFFRALMNLKDRGHAFELLVCGESYSKSPRIFEEARKDLSAYIVHWGFVESRNQYFELLKTCHVLPVTNNQEFFGLSVMEAIAAGVHPILPNRLSYPELYPEIPFFYESDSELESELEGLISSGQFQSFSNSVQSYDWSEVGETYKRLISDIVD